MSRHTDPRLAALFAPDSSRKEPAAPASAQPKAMPRIIAQQADGHASVAVRADPSGQPVTHIPNGTTLHMMARQGEFVKGVLNNNIVYVKARNVRLVTSPPPGAPAAPSAPKPTAKVSGKAPVANTPPAAAEPATTVCKVTVNGTPYTIDMAKNPVDPSLTVHDWLVLNVPGTGIRRSCGMGYCGSCLCMLSYFDATSNRVVHRSFNSCLRPILSCNGMSITTGQGVGTTKNPNPIQESLAKHCGTQCGYCSVGMVMNLYAHLTDKPGKKWEASELDTLIDGNICRCTGYRPILDTYKSFATEKASPPNTDHLRRKEIFGKHVEERRPPSPPSSMLPAPPRIPAKKGNVKGANEGVKWVEVSTEDELCDALTSMASLKDVFLVRGHTSQGLFQSRKPDAYISIGGIKSLGVCEKTSTGFTLGATTTMTEAIEFFKGLIAQSPGDASVRHLEQVVKHASLSPGSTIRNMGSLGGNVMIAHEHQNDGLHFPVEWALLFHALGASVTVVDAATRASTSYTFEAFYATSMKGKYIQKFTIPFGVPNLVFTSYRASQRLVYSQAFLSAAMRAEVSQGRIKPGSAVIVFNNVGNRPARLPTVERLLDNFNVTDQAAFQSTICPALTKALNIVPGYGLPEYKKSVALSYLYKFFLLMQPALAPSLRQAAAPWLDRATTKGSQSFQPNPALYPLGEAMPKIDGLKQVVGEAQYIQDIPIPNHCLHACNVRATAVGTIVSIDTSAAAEIEGYKGLVTAADVPKNVGFGGTLIADKVTSYIGEIVAVVLADTQQKAVDCARAVKVNYTATKANPIVTIEQAVAAKSFPPGVPPKCVQGDVDTGFKGSDHVFTDTFTLGGQYHYHLETLSALALPSGEGSFTIHSAVQLPPPVAQAVAACLEVPQASIDLRNRRCGGGFGGKLSNSINPTCLTAVCANKMKVPVRMIYELEDNMKCAGLRPSWQVDIKVGCNNDGKINAVKLMAYMDGGKSGEDSGFTTQAYLGAFDNCYNVANWDVTVQVCNTDLPGTTSMRAPGWLPAIYTAEHVVNVVARNTGLTTTQVREKNFYQRGDVTPYGLKLTNYNVQDLWEKVKSSFGYAARVAAVNQWNASNRWVKKGLALVPSKFGVVYSGSQKANENLFDCNVKVLKDGSVVVLCGGTEIGQGLTTKVAQTVAYHLGVPVDAITFAEQTTTVLGTTGASDVTGGSIGSELSCLAAKNCCDKINAALSPVRKILPSGTWSQLVAKAYELGIELSFLCKDAGVIGPQDKSGHVYNTYGVVAMECTVDALTGQLDISRADIAFDLGRSVNPDIDIGQIEGGFVMGLGFATTEEIEYDQKGDLLWSNYKPPTPWEIPAEFNVTLLHGIPNPITAGGGKAIGEPPVTLTYAVVEASQMAVEAAAKDGNTTAPPPDVPFTIQRRHLACNVSPSQFTFN
eukprot:Sspe_Gene.33825::Locus_16472_Transcript_1_1_Confidence_1.000_Length_4396::g.33825::m.33825/K00106/XDH; xanthine dehydrogenase/oxidase